MYPRCYILNKEKDNLQNKDKGSEFIPAQSPIYSIAKVPSGHNVRLAHEDCKVVIKAKRKKII